jgi:hypothetical protein
VVESFWAIPDVSNIRTPLSILKEQAAALTEQTKGTLVGMVEVQKNSAEDLEIQLEVSVPALNDYRYRLVTYSQPIELYPGWLTVLSEPSRTVADETTFVSQIKRALSSERVKNILTSLLSQVIVA